MNTKLNEHEAGDVLLSLLSSGGLITESKASIISSKIDLLQERADAQNPNQKSNSLYPFSVQLDGDQIEYYGIKWADFWDIWADIANYKTYEDIFLALGVSQQAVKKLKAGGIKDKLDGMLKHFSKTYSNRYLIPTTLKTSPTRGMGRNDFFTDHKYNSLNDVPTKIENNVAVMDKDGIAKDRGYEDPDEYLMALDSEPDKEDILWGVRGQDTSRTGRILNTINKEELFSGEFYSNMSRIKKQSLFNWLRLWKKDTMGLKGEGSFLGRKWKKIFIMGYQVDKSFLFEIWFNTIDSTYTLHDHRGGELSRRVKTLAEVMKSLFLQLAKQSPKDIEFLQNPADKSVVDSFLRAMRTDIDSRTDDMLKREKKEQERIDQKAEELARKKEEFKKTLKDIKRDVFGATGGFQKRDMKDVEVKIGSEVRAYKKWQKEALDAKVRKAAEKLQKGEITKQKYEEIVMDLIKKAKSKINAKADDAVKSMSSMLDGLEDYVPDTVKKDYNIKPSRTRSFGERRVQDTFKKVVNENMDITSFSSQRQMADEFAQEIQDETNKPAYNNRVSNIRKEADRDSINFRKLQDMLMQTIVKYTDDTRMGRYGSTVFDRILNKGRKDRVVYPTDKPSLWNRLKNFIRGTRYRADFICGYSLSDRVDFEIWYVTEPNPDYVPGSNDAKLISSFYVYDITSAMLIRKYIPYYRNAEQVVLQKISTVA